MDIREYVDEQGNPLSSEVVDLAAQFAASKERLRELREKSADEPTENAERAAKLAEVLDHMDNQLTEEKARRARFLLFALCVCSHSLYWFSEPMKVSRARMSSMSALSWTWLALWLLERPTQQTVRTFWTYWKDWKLKSWLRQWSGNEVVSVSRVAVYAYVCCCNICSAHPPERSALTSSGWKKGFLSTAKQTDTKPRGTQQIVCVHAVLCDF